MKKHILCVAALACSLAAPTAFAQSNSVPAQQFAPAPGGDNSYVTVQGTGILPNLVPSVGAYLNYAHDPLVLRRLSTNEEIKLLEHQLQLDIQAAIGLFDFLELGVSIPVTVWQASGDPSPTLPQPNPVNSFTMGDIRLYPKVAFHDPEGFGAAVIGVVTLPSGEPESYQGDTSVTFEPRLALQYIFSESIRLGGTVGYVLREDQKLFNIDVGNELTWGGAFEWRFSQGFAAILEGYGRIATEGQTSAVGADQEEQPMEVSLAGRIWPAPQHTITVGVARGLTDGYGSPDLRVFAGYNFTPKEDRDPDGDGILGENDKCPFIPEDFDKFQDEDGCDDPDNDSDGIRDTNDQCPMEPEDYDGFEDTEGCPDPDNDADGVLDVDDKCPMVPEDKDGWEDADGCEDPDNDSDGVLDVQDGAVGDNGFGACMNDPEDVDGFQDEDGCPDGDNDGDGILDIEDTCPDDPEDKCKVVVKGKCEIAILDKVHFHYDKDIIKKKSYPILNEVAAVFKKNPWIELVEVQGHTDSDGTDAYNEDLSQRRAASVKVYLQEQGIPASKLTPKGYGEKKPIASNNNAKGRADNRRVQFVILKPTADDCRK